MSDYRLSVLQLVRFVGALLVGAAVLIFCATFAVAALGASAAVLIAVAVVALVGLLGVALWLRSVVVVHLDGEGYRVRLVRGVGVPAARWRDVADAATTHVAAEPCVVLTLHDGRTSTIPVGVLEVDREAFVRDLQAHLQAGQGLRPL